MRLRAQRLDGGKAGANRLVAPAGGFGKNQHEVVKLTV